MLSSEFALKLARLATAAAQLRTLPDNQRSGSPPSAVTLYSSNLQTVFRVEVGSVDDCVTVVVTAGTDPLPLVNDLLTQDRNLCREIAVLVELAEEEFEARKHRRELIRLLAELDPPPDLDALRTFCVSAGIKNTGDQFTVEECATVTAFLMAPKLSDRTRTVLNFRVAPDPDEDLMSRF